jgi:hypothetical protein
MTFTEYFEINADVIRYPYLKGFFFIRKEIKVSEILPYHIEQKISGLV